MMRAILFLVSLAFAGGAWADGPRLHVVASFSIIADLAQQVGGDRIALGTLVGPEADTHDYEPRPADALGLAQADVVLVNGLGLEGFLDRLIAASGITAPVVTLSDGVTPLPGPHGDTTDPHAWQAPQNVRTYVTNIAAAFCTADPEGCPFYQENARSYGAALDTLDADIRARLAPVPEAHRIVVTPHDAFGYFGMAYGVRFLSPQGTAPEAEASAADLAALIREMRLYQVQAVLGEIGTNPALITQIARETGLPVAGMLFSDALSWPDGPAPTYLDMMRHNAEVIAVALGGSDSGGADSAID